MKKYVRRILVCALLVVACWSAFLVSDRRKLNKDLIRFHVVAHSDSDVDQSIKLKVRDVVLKSMQADLKKLTDINEARDYLENNLPKIQFLVDRTLNNLGFQGNSKVSLCKERFDVRHYDTFSLPAGVYNSLRIVIGDGLGKNWWCVSFPTLCVPATTDEFVDAAVGAGFSKPLVETLSGKQNYEIRFFFLNQLGKLENIFYQE